MVSDSNSNSVHNSIWNAWKGLNRRARERVNCIVTFSDYKEFKTYALDNGWFEGCLVCRNKDVGNYSPENIRFDTKQSNTEEAISKHYKFIDPNGEVREIFNLNKFCIANNLHSGHMSVIHNGGVRKSHKGWTKYDQ